MRDHTASLWARRAGLSAGLALALLRVPLAHATEPLERVRSLDAPVGAPPAVLVLEAGPDDTALAVRARSPGAPDGAREIARVPLVEGGAFRGAIRWVGATYELFVSAQQRHGPAAQSYHTALFRVDAGGGVRRLLEGLTDASSPLVTARGTVLVQRGEDGSEPALEGNALRHRDDALRIEAVDPRTGATRTVWSGTGALAFLAAPLRDDGALLYTVHAQGAALLELDAGGSAPRTLVASMQPLARDFSYDPLRDEVLYARATPGDRTHAQYELVAQPRDGGAPRVLHAAASDRLVPRALCGRAVAYSASESRGLRVVDVTQAQPAFAQAPQAPFGEGTDTVVAASDDCRWIVVRHISRGPVRTERHWVYAPATGARVALETPHDQSVEILGFLRGGR